MLKLTRTIPLDLPSIVVKFCAYVPRVQISTTLNVPSLILSFASSPTSKLVVRDVGTSVYFTCLRDWMPISC